MQPKPLPDAENKTGLIESLWQKREQGYIQGVNNKQIFWTSLTSANHDKAVVIVNGRIESAWKYQELFYELYHQGFDVYSFDHRGQGMSERLADDPQIGHVGFFSDYVEDMASALKQFNLAGYQHKFILAHSMGGAIATRYLQSQSGIKFDAIALSAPMYGVDMPWYMRPVANYLTPLITALVKQPFYITKNKAYFAKPFEINPLTSSHTRYKWFRDLYEKMPELKLGGPSARWVWQGLKGAELCIKEADKVTIPLLLLQGGQDKIVSNQAQTAFIKKLARTNPDCRMTIIEGSKHEILFESDTHRDIALQEILSFFQQPKRGN